MSADKDRIVTTYTGTADHFDTLPFWHHFGRRTIDRLSLPLGARVLDLCCGTGASALHAAERVGPSGHVLGVDLTDALVTVARRTAAGRRLTNVEFRNADVEALAFGDRSFDAVVSVFGIFFLDDMPGLVRRAWRWLRPGGPLAVTTWGRTVLAPGEAIFWEAVHREDPAIDRVSPADRLAEPPALVSLFREAGLPVPEVEAEMWEMPLASPEDFWAVVLGTSNRVALDGLDAEARSRVRQAVTAALEARRVRALDSEVLYAVARKAV